MSNEIGATQSAISWWARIPVVIRAVVLGVLVVDVGVYGYSLLLAVNAKTSLQIPWAAVISVPLLVAYWKFLGGKGPPKSTSEARRLNLRAMPLRPKAWLWAAITAAFGLLFTLNFGEIWQRQFNVFPDAGDLIPQGVEIPWWTLYPSFLMVSVFAGFCEEAGYRGYLQSMIERRHGAVIAICISSATFTIAHFGHDWGFLMAAPFFIAGLWYGALTYISGSIWPMVVVHTGLDIYLIGRRLILGAEPNPPLLSESGFDQSAMVACALAILGGLGLIYSLRRLSNATKEPQTL